MSSAPKHAISPPPERGAQPSDRAPLQGPGRGAEGLRAGRRWESILAVLSVCLPIPLLAATGLSIPLPAGVERIGAALVAWADDAVDGSPLGEGGSIILADSESAAPEVVEKVGVTLLRTTGKTRTTAPADGTGGAGNPTKEKDEGGGGGSSPPDPGGGDPDDDPGVIEETVNEVSEETEPVVDEVEKTVDELLPADELLGLGE